MKYTLHILFVIVILLTLLGCSNMTGNEPQTEEPIGGAVWVDDSTEFEIQKTDAEWRDQLNDEQYKILRKKGTERSFTSPLNENKEKGIYYSAASLQPVYSSEAKFDSGTGWPSFYEPITPDAVSYKEDNSLFSKRVEILDSKSGSHLGHVFNDGPSPTGKRYCMNGNALIFVPEGGEPPRN